MPRCMLAAALILIAAAAQAGLCSHGKECHAPSCAAPCECVSDHGCAPECATAACGNGCTAAPTCCAPSAPSCCAPSACSENGCNDNECCPAQPSCCAPQGCGENGCTEGCTSHACCKPKKKSCLARLWDLEKRKNKCLRRTFLGWMD